MSPSVAEFHGESSKGLSGKVALITGATSGIGRAAATLFAEAGAKVVLAARGAERGEAAARGMAAAGHGAVFVQADVSKADQVEELVAATVARFGRLDCAFNNAAELRLSALKPLAEVSEEEFDHQIRSNLKSVWACMKFEITQMLRQEPRGGSIVNTSSVNGLGGTRMAAPYAAAKAGVLGLTKSAALEYGGAGIRVNALVAGAFDTPMLEGVISSLSAGKPEIRDAIMSRYRELTATGRIGNPFEAAQAAVWLCSDAASYVTGHSMIVDGGLTASTR